MIENFNRVISARCYVDKVRGFSCSLSVECVADSGSLEGCFLFVVGSPSKILTVDNLRKRNIIIVDRCCLCKRDGETVDHLILYCDVASTLWIHVFTRFGMSWVVPKRVIDLFACWWKSGKPRSAAVWKMVPTCIFWCLER
jgi:hypothetical protein